MSMGCRYHAGFTFRGEYFADYDRTELGAVASVVARAAARFNLSTWDVAPAEWREELLDVDLTFAAGAN